MAVKTTLKKPITLGHTVAGKQTETANSKEAFVKQTKEARAGIDSASSAPVKKKCFFCEAKKEPTYTDTAVLRKFMSDRARIVGKHRSGACSKHQRRISKEISYARHLSMMPFVNKL